MELNQRPYRAKPLMAGGAMRATQAVVVKRALPLPTGYVKVMPFIAERDTSPRLEGILVPGMDKNGELRNRIILADRGAPEWFHALCEKLSTDPRDDLRIRVRVVSVSNNGTTAYVRPFFESEEEVRQDWSQELSRREHFPKDIKDCMTLENVIEFIYRHVADREEMSFIRASIFDDSAIAVGRNGIILHLTGAMDLWKKRDELFEGILEFDQLTRDHIRWTRALDL
jgi:hypothetical protein